MRFLKDYKLIKVNGVSLGTTSLYVHDSKITTLQSYPQYGDTELDQLKSEIEKSELSDPLTLSAMERSKLDFEKIGNVESHYFVDDIVNMDAEEMLRFRDYGCRCLKIKISEALNIERIHLEALLDFLPETTSLRLDANSKYHYEDWLSADLEAWSEIFERVEFIEDPFSGTERELSVFMDRFKVKVAIDWIQIPIESKSKFVKVVKPARDYPFSKKQIEEYDRYNSILVTNYMGHPIEQLHAQAVADKLQKELKVEVFGGYITNHLFQWDRKYLNVSKARLLPILTHIEDLVGDEA